MTIADKLTRIAENSRALYDAGYKAAHIEGIDVRTVGFDDWHRGTTREELVAFEHGLGIKPSFVALIPNDMTALETLELPSNITSVICQADGVYNPETNTHCPANFIRWKDGAFASSARFPNDGSNRLIDSWDDKYVYVNANGQSEAWPPASVTTFTLICCADLS